MIMGLDYMMALLEVTARIVDRKRKTHSLNLLLKTRLTIATIFHFI